MTTQPDTPLEITREEILEAELTQVKAQLRQTQLILSAVMSQRDEATNKLADAIATIAMQNQQ